MIPSKDIEAYSYLVSNRFEAINSHYLKLIGEQIKDIGRLSPTNIHRLQQMAKYDQNIKEINSLLAKESNRTLEELYKVYELSGMSLYDDTLDLFKANGKTQIPFKDNMAIQGYLNSVKNLTQGTFMNMSNTTITSHQNYRKLVDTAIDAIATGQTDYNSAIRQQMMAIADEGLSVTYASGVKRRLDSAVRMNILEGVRKVSEGTRKVAGEQFGADGYEISVHALCAEDHIDIQGRQFAIGSEDKIVDGVTYESFDNMNSSLQREIGTCNCKHSVFPIVLGISVPAYTDKELKQYKDNSEQKVTLTTGYNADGTPRTRTMTKYEATQYQRNLETEIRRAKDRHIIAENAGDDVGTKQAKDKILALRKTYSFISQEAGLTPKWDRTFVPGYTGKQTSPKHITLGHNQIKELTLREIGEILSYKSFDYYTINEILRTGGYNKLSDEQKDKVKILDRALTKLPKYEGTLSRSLYFNNQEEVNEFLSNINNKETITFEQYISTTKSEQLYNPDGQIQIYIQDSKNGRLLDEFDNGENEVLYERNSKFKIINVMEQDNIYYILLEEL